MNVLLEYNKSNLKINLSAENTHIELSCIVKSPKDMKMILHQLQERYPSKDLAINKLSITEMVREWKTHNILCDLGFMKERTCSVDLNVDKNIFAKIAYFIVSLFYFNFK